MKRPLLLVMGLVVPLSIAGCSALHFGGDSAGHAPGVRVRAATLFTPAEVEVTSNLDAEIRELDYAAASKDAPARFKLRGNFGQDAAAVVREEPAKILAIAELQQVQVDYVRETWAGIVGVAEQVMPLLNLLATAQFRQTETGVSLDLPGGISVGARRLTSPAEISQWAQAALARVERATQPVLVVPTTQPAADGP